MSIFPAGRPVTVLVDPRLHPESRPQPVSAREFGANLHSTVPERETVNSADPGRLDGVEIVPTCARRPLAPIEHVGGAVIPRHRTPHIHSVSIPQIGLADLVREEGRLDVENSIADVAVGAIVGVSSNSPFPPPLIVIVCCQRLRFNVSNSSSNMRLWPHAEQAKSVINSRKV